VHQASGTNAVKVQPWLGGGCNKKKARGGGVLNRATKSVWGGRSKSALKEQKKLPGKRSRGTWDKEKFLSCGRDVTRPVHKGFIQPWGGKERPVGRRQKKCRPTKPGGQRKGVSWRI